MNIGMVGTARVIVTDENTAIAMKSGSLPVFATPCMLALMEQAACAAVETGLSPGETTVGVSADFSHTAATPIGKEVIAEAKLIAVDGRRLSFEIFARCGEIEIGRGTHERFVVNIEKFMGRL